MTRRLLLALTAASVAAPVAALSAPAPRPSGAPDIAFTVSMPRPSSHLLEVEMRLTWRGRRPPAVAELVMPVWTPGSYLIREYSRHVQEFRATDAAGRPLTWSKSAKNRWHVTGAGAREWRVAYRVYANEPSVRTNELNERHAFWTNAALLMYPEGHLKVPSTLRVSPPEGWQVATGLEPVAGEANTFGARDFDELYDCPVEVAPLRVLEFSVRGLRHRIAITGQGQYDAEKLVGDVRKVVETTIAMMGEVPYPHYTFLLTLLPEAGGGGLEHRNSTALRFGPSDLRPADRWRSLMRLVAHEYFHVWNVKHIRPDALGPFDYERENYTRLLWVAEGATSYYETLLLRRAGLMTDQQFLDALKDEIQQLQDTPGRRLASLEQASFDAWIEHYRPDENTPNTQISYYDKGAVVAALLDLEIRRRTDGGRSLDDVMRLLWSNYAERGRNYTPADFQRACETVARQSLDPFFSRYVRGTEELDYSAALSAVGLRLEPVAEPGQPPAAKARLGAGLAEANGRVRITSVLVGAAADEAGLSVNDEILALDGRAVDRASLTAGIEERKPGDTARVTFFRDGELMTREVRLTARPPALRIVSVADPTLVQQRLYEGWLGAPLKKPIPPGPASPAP